MYSSPYVYTLFEPIAHLSESRVNPLCINTRIFKKNIYCYYAVRIIVPYTHIQSAICFCVWFDYSHFASPFQRPFFLLCFTTIATDSYQTRQTTLKSFHILTHSRLLILQKHKNTKENKKTKKPRISHFFHIYSALCACICWYFFFAIFSVLFLFYSSVFLFIRANVPHFQCDYVTVYAMNINYI